MSPGIPLPRLSPVVVLAGLSAACWPVFGWWVERMLDGSDDPLGIAALLAAGWLIWNRRREMAVSRGGLWAALAVILTQGILPVPPLLRGACFVCALALAFGLPRRHAGLAALLMLSLPALASLQFFFAYPLRILTAEISRCLLWCLGFASERSGTLLRWNHRDIGVDAACSGVKMLWAALFVASVAASRSRLAGKRTAILLSVTVVLVVSANGVRSAILFFPEAKLVTWPEWTHDGAGLVLFAVVAGAILRLAEFRKAARLPELCARQPAGRLTFSVFVGISLLCAGVAWARHDRNNSAARVVQIQWPGLFEGEILTPVPLGEQERRFAASFPGQMNVFTTSSGRTVIFRLVQQATRSLHSSAQCLQASGLTVHPESSIRDDLGRLWGRWSVKGSNEIASVRELIIDADGRTFTDAPAWFWPALFGGSRGPWTAISVME